MKRIDYVDVMRGICILLIVLGHIMTYCDELQIIYKIIYGIHVPAFFFISGLIHRHYDSFKDMIIKKWKRLLIPYFVYAFLFLIPYMLIGKYAIDSLGTNTALNFRNSIYEILYGTAFNQSLKQNSPLWFLPSLFITEIVIWLIVKLRQNKKHRKIYDASIIIVLFVFGEIVNIFKPNLFFGISSFMTLGIFYYIGFLLKPHMDTFKCNFTIMSFISLIFSLILIIINQKISYTDYRYGCYFIFFISALSAAMELLKMSISIRSNKMLAKLGEKSLYIMIFHKIIIVFLQVLFVKIVPVILQNNIIIQIIFVILTLIITILICLLIEKIICFLKIKLKTCIGGDGNNEKCI